MDGVSTLQMLWLPVLVVGGVVVWVFMVIRQALVRKHAARQAPAVVVRLPNDKKIETDES